MMDYCYIRIAYLISFGPLRYSKKLGERGNVEGI